MKKNLLWATEIYSFKSDNIDNDKIKEILLEKEKSESGRSLSNVGGWQSEDTILEEDGFSGIKDFLFECVSSIKNEIYIDDVKFFLAQSWASVNRNGHYNVNHDHGNSQWSCAYYVTETYSAPIYFTDPRMRATMCAVSDLQKNPYSYNIGPEKNEPGDAIFFPSWLEHSVANNLTDNPRISISCNFVLHDGNNLLQVTG